uniref:Uncharacterized protein n=1 Tax=Molossus molossus TaxID=27622 RepID=A0A7J8C8T1_MOLMO|nr:hypothetical protein HJG59_009917 [Molossus molossus]
MAQATSTLPWQPSQRAPDWTPKVGQRSPLLLRSLLMLCSFLCKTEFNVLESERVCPTCLQAPARQHLVPDSVTTTAPGPQLSTPGHLSTETAVRQPIWCPVLLDTLVAIEEEASSLLASVSPLCAVGLLD